MRWKGVTWFVFTTLVVAKAEVDVIDNGVLVENVVVDASSETTDDSDATTNTYLNENTDWDVNINSPDSDSVSVVNNFARNGTSGENVTSIEEIDQSNEDLLNSTETTTNPPLESTTNIQTTTIINEINGNDTESNEDEQVDLPTSTENDNTQAPPLTEAPIVSSGEDTSASRSIEYIEPIEELVQTEFGLVRGYYLHGTTDIRSFIDIPYGKFTGFLAPSRPDQMEGIHQVHEHAKRCPQLQHPNIFVGGDDCLTLSVFAPSNTVNASVLFHIHDGLFSAGSADPSIYGPEYLVRKGIVIVLPNYRLGPLGFLCLQNETVPGNAGLKDLTLALEWTKNNIEAFGGNPNNIVVSGEGHSGALAGLLALSPKSKDFVKGVIAESGSMLSPWVIDRSPITAASELQEIIRESYTHNTENDSVFDDIELVPLITAANGIRFKPCIESETDVEAFMNKTPWDLLHDHQIDKTFMIGSANHAGLQDAIERIEDIILQINSNAAILLPDDLNIENEELRTEIAETIKSLYFGVEVINSDHIENISLYYTDINYLGPTRRAASLLVEAGVKVYFYEFSFVGDLNRELHVLSTSVNGAVRGDMAGYLFTTDGSLVHEETDEGHMVELLTNLWASFVHNGTPTSEGIEWTGLQLTDQIEEDWLSIGSEVKMETGLHVERLQLWTEIYEEHYVYNAASFTHFNIGVWIVILVLAYTLLRP